MTFHAVLAVSCLFLLAAALHDVAARTIPNAAACVVFALGMILRFRAGTLVPGLAVVAAVTLLGAIAFQRGLMGGGDVKLLGAVALLVSPGRAPTLVLTIALAGGALSVTYIALSRVVPAPRALRPPTLVARCLRAELWRIRRRASLPYGVAIAAGTILTLSGAAV